MRIRSTRWDAANKVRFTVRALFCVMLLVLAAPFAAHAQAYYGTVTGSVTDTSGAAIPGATVTLINNGTAATYTATTSDTGAYSFAQVPVGTYEIHVQKASFKEFVAKNVEVHVSTSTEIDASLQVGAVSESVTVQAAAIQVQTSSAAVGEVVSGAQVRELPLNGENFVQLTQLSPGVSPANSFDGVDKGLGGGVDFSVDGNPYTDNLFLVDGVNNNDVGSNRTILVYPAVDSIAEFKMIRNDYGPEYGQAAGAIISLTTKSGQNQFHGGAFYSGRNDAVAANDWFSNNDLLGKAELRRNDVGYDFSGPVKKDKLFFWWNQEWDYQTNGIPEGSCVPSAAEISGDFTQGTNCGAAVPDFPADVASEVTGGTSDGSGGIIGGKITNPDAAALLYYGSWYPLPNLTTPLSNGYNWTQSVKGKQNWSEWNVRGDYDISKSETATFRYTNDTWTNPFPNGGAVGWGDSNYPTLGASWSQPSKSVMAKLSSVINNTMVNDVEFGYGHNAIITTLAGSNAGLATAINAAVPESWPASLKSPSNSEIPGSNWGGLYPYGSYQQTLWEIAPYGNHEDLYTVQDNLSKVMGNHTFKVGVFFGTNAKIENNAGGSDLVNMPQGTCCISNATGAANAQTNNPLGNVLLPGIPTGGAPAQLFNLSESSSNPSALVHWHDFEWYFGDTWKVNRKLTFSYGFRYSFLREPFSGDNNWASWNIADWSSTEATANPSDACNGTIIVPGTTPCQNAVTLLNGLGISLPLSNGTPGPNRALVNNNDHDIAPRLGIAWDVAGDGKTAVRLGIGQFFQREAVGLDERMAWTAPFVISASAVRPLDTAAQLANPQVSPTAAKDPAAITPNSWQWNASVEREIAPNTALEVGYVGNTGIHLTSWQYVNNVPQSDWLNEAFANSAADQNSYRPAFNFGSIGQSQRLGHATYNSLQILFRSQLSNFSSFQAAYTHSHSYGNVAEDDSSGGPDSEAITAAGFPALDKGNTNINRPNIFVANEVFYLPKLADKSAFERASLGGWELNSIVTAENGSSLSIFTNGITGADGSTLQSLIGTGYNGNNRPLTVAGLGCDSRTTGEAENQILNPNAFTLVGYTIGTIPANMAQRGVCSGSSYVNFDVELGKNWQFREHYRVELKLDAFNIFNHTNFNAGGLEGAGFNPSSPVLCGTGTECTTANNVISATGYTGPGGWGSATSVHPPRQVQYSLKFTF